MEPMDYFMFGFLAGCIVMSAVFSFMLKNS